MPTRAWIHLSAAALAATAALTFAVVLACASVPVETVKDPATTATTSSSACAKDADCKGDRICNQGQCVTPR